jgi:nucleoside-diphosphate-sugar epimerase
VPTEAVRDSRLASQRALVTGATGFIGSALCRRLVASGMEVHGVSRVGRSTPDEIRWWTADLSDAGAADQIVRKIRPDTVFHLASHVSGDRALAAVASTLRDNLVTTVNLLTAAADAGGTRVVLAGSMEESLPDDPAPSSPYAAAKTAATSYAQLFDRLYGLPVVNLRVFMVYGPGQWDDTKLVPYVIGSLLRGEGPGLSSGMREVDWVYIDDVVAAFVAAAGSPTAPGSTVDVGSGALVSIRSLVERIVPLVGGDVRPVFGALPDRPGERPRVADLTPGRELIGWQPSTPLDLGLARTVEWFRERLLDGQSPPS